MNNTENQKSRFIIVLGTIIMFVSLCFIIAYQSFGTAEATLTTVTSRTCHNGGRHSSTYEGYEYYFKYIVNGKIYKDKRVCKPVPKSKTLKIKYNPQNPQNNLDGFTLYISIYTLIFGSFILCCGYKPDIILKMHAKFNKD